MFITMKQENEYAVGHVHIEVPVRYDEEDMPKDFPLREGDVWRAKVNLGLHKIENWPQGKTGEFNMKVTDEGIYTLYDVTGKKMGALSGYVPNNLLPGEYGDYLHLVIDENGVITNWSEVASLEDFQGDNFKVDPDYEG